MAPACVDPSHVPFTRCRPTPGWLGVKKHTSYFPFPIVRSFVRSFCLLIAYSAILRFRAVSLRSHEILHEWLAFHGAFLNIHRSGVLTALAWLVPHETAAVSAYSVCTIQSCTISPHAKPHTEGARVFSCNLPPVLLAEWPGSFRCYSGNTGMEQIPK